MSGRVTRQSKRLSLLSETATPLSTASPIFSGAQSIESATTPITSQESDDEVNVVAAAKPRDSKPRALPLRSASKSKTRSESDKKKRPATIDDDPESDVESSRGHKRRAVSSQVYVSIPSRGSNRAKVKRTSFGKFVLTEFVGACSTEESGESQAESEGFA